MTFHIKARAIIVSVLISIASQSQQLNVGATMPDIKITDVINSDSATLDLSQFNGKCIILEFWNHACTSCIQSFPKIDSLQKKFRRELQFILVNKENRDSTIRFFEKRKRIKPPSVPMVTNANYLSELFPHAYYPYSVWIDKNKIVRYLSGSVLTASNLKAFLKNESIELRDVRKKIIFGTALFNSNIDIQKKLLYYSYIVRCDEGYDFGSASLASDSNGVKLSMNCASIVDLYKKAYSEHYKYNFNTHASLILNVSDTSLYVRPSDSEIFEKWKKENRYSYALLVPLSEAKDAYRIMQHDLSRYFNVDAHVEKRKAKSWVLVRTTKLNKLHTNGGGVIDNFYFENMRNPSSDSFRTLRNLPFRFFVQALSNNIPYYTGLPFFDETRFKGAIDISISAESMEPFDMMKFRRELRRYDLDLVEKNRLIDVLVITERK